MARKTPQRLTTFTFILLAALVFRVGIATRLANDEPVDGQVYAQIARNLLEHGVYSHATEPPYEPTLIRLPGYPIFLAGVYSVFGSKNNSTVRLLQALVDTATCGLIALLAYLWEPVNRLKRRSSIAALTLAAVCPFTVIYVATILSETLASFLGVAAVLAATLAFRSSGLPRTMLLWGVAGLVAGLAVLVRPDSGLLAGAIAVTLVVSALTVPKEAEASEAPGMFQNISRTSIAGAVFALSLCLILLPWTLRNYRVFNVFQPLAPAHAQMPGEFVPLGYFSWIRTWIADGRYVGSALWPLGEGPIKIEDLPDEAFDSAEEKQRVTELLSRYNHPTGEFDRTFETESSDAPQPGVNGSSNEQADDITPEPEDKNAEPEQEEPDDQSQNRASSDQQIEQSVQMTPAIDAAFGQIASERISRHPIRYYVLLPLRRGLSLWFDTHSQYYPFEGELLPLGNLDYSVNQHIWLPVFALLTLLYSLLGIVGGWVLWHTRSFIARRWVLLVVLIVLLRLGFFAAVENPETRYVVELFPFFAALGGIGWTHYRAQQRTN